MEGATNNSNNNNGNNNDNNRNNNNNNNSPSVPDTSRTMVPKGNPSQTSENVPPPAYTPRQISDLPALAAQTIRSRQQETMSRIFAQRPYAEILSSATADDEHDEPTDPADNNPISLRITTAVNITRNNNLVCLPATPADHANAIAKAVVQAIQQNSSGQCGIPMIDENGCPRPLKIEVDAGMLVEGSGNVVGNEQVIAEVLRQRGSLRRTRDDAEDDDDEDIPDVDGPPPSKRRRSE